jgi:hypothetical protein
MKARILNDKICFSEYTYSLSSPSMSALERCHQSITPGGIASEKPTYRY